MRRMVLRYMRGKLERESGNAIRAPHVITRQTAIRRGALSPWSGVTQKKARRFSAQHRGLSCAGSLSAELASLSELRVLNMANNQLTGTLPPALGSSLRNLQELDLSGNPLQARLRAWAPVRLAPYNGWQQTVQLCRRKEASQAPQSPLGCSRRGWNLCRGLLCLWCVLHAQSACVFHG